MKKTIAVITALTILFTGASAAVLSPVKAPWISREDSINLYQQNPMGYILSGGGVTAVSNEKLPTFDYSAFLPPSGAIDAGLAAKQGVHPRLYFDKAGFDALRERVKTPAYELMMQKAAANGETILKKPITPYNPNDAAMEETHREIDIIAPLVFQYKITGDRRFFDRAIEWAVAACTDYPQWGVANNDLSAGHILWAMAVLYDWCYNEISPDNRKLFADTMAARGSITHATLTNNLKTWATSYLQNHGWINLTGLAAAGIAIYDEHPSVKPWFNDISTFMAKAISLMSEDGSSHEGIGYWAYGVDWLLRYNDLAKDFFGIDGYKSPFFQETAVYRIYSGLPRSSWTSTGKVTFDYGDANGKDYDSASAILQRLASVYDDPYAQWYADDILKSVLNFDQYCWLNIWRFNPDVEMKNPSDLPTLKTFTDLGLVMARSNWAGNESYIGFKNGPVLGTYATRLLNEQNVTHPVGDMAHSHPDNNHFILFANGEMLLRDDGYVKKYTNSHNTLLVDGGGQAGEGYTWFNNDSGKSVDKEVAENDSAITKVVSKDSYDYWVADAAKAYKASAGVQKFKRHMIYLKDDDVLLVADDIKLIQTKNLELRFFPESQNMTVNGNEAEITGRSTKFDIQLLTPSGAEIKAEPVAIAKDRNGGSMNRKAVRVTAKKNAWVNALALKWSYPNLSPAEVSYSSDGRNMTFKVEDKIIKLNLDTNAIKVEDHPEIKDAEATLKNLTINNNPIKGFDPNKLELEYNLDDFAKLIRTPLSEYKINAIPTGKRSNIQVTMPESIPGVLGIKVTSADRTKTNEYKVNMVGTMISGEAIPIVDATATGNGSGTTPQMVFDNDFASYWTDEGDGKYIQLDLGSAYDLIGLDVAWYKGDLRKAKFSIDVSTDGKTFTEVLAGESSGTSLEPEFYQFAAKARYIRLIGHGNTEGSYWHSPAEMAVYQAK